MGLTGINFNKYFIRYYMDFVNFYKVMLLKLSFAFKDAIKD